jgi:AcrR family transcriptional regulator
VAPATPRKKRLKKAYHHGHLREALLRAALELIGEHGVAALSLREVARRAGVSHAAPAHHFADKAGLLTALAAEGFRRFKAAQLAGAERGGDDPRLRFGWQGWAYVMFAAEHRPYFELMFRPEHLRPNDPELDLAAGEAYAVLLDGVRATLPAPPSDEELALLATTAWAHSHGLATLWLDGNLAQYAGLSDLDALARKVFGLPSA